MADEPSPDLALAWDAYCETLRQAGHTLLEGATGRDARTRAEGVRYLLGLVTSGAQQALALRDPDAPAFLRNPDSLARWGAENADNQYLWARIRPDATYVIRGARGTAFDFLIEVKEGYLQLGDGRNFATLTAADVDVAPDGSFDVRLGGAPRRRGWLPLDPDAGYVVVRQYLCDWEHELPARFTIEAQHDGRPAGFTPTDALDVLASAGGWTQASADVWAGWLARIEQAWVPGRIAPARSYAGGADDILYGNDWFRIGEDEAWVLEFSPPDARYWQVQLGDAWFRSLDWSAGRTSLNHTQVHVDPDGRVRIVVAHRDPGVWNWLDTAGHREGLLQHRWIWSRDNPTIDLTICRSTEVGARLPASTRRASTADRAHDLSVRRRARARREPTS